MSGGSMRVYELSEARPDRWFDEVLKQSKDFERACHIIGRNTLGLGLIAGARILSLTANPHSQDLTTVEFSIGHDPTVRQVPLSDFRETIAQHLLLPLQTPALPEEPSIEALQAHIGGRYLLAATLFHVSPIELRHEDGRSEVTVEFNELRHVLGLDDFREVVDDRVRSELGLGHPEEVSIDLAVVEQAEEANADENWAATIAMLNPWLGPISTLLRTGEAKGLTDEIHERLSVSLDLLGAAYAGMGEHEAANEVLRLGVQWAGESGQAATLFLKLGRASAVANKHGEAIGLLRRAIRLGGDEQTALPLLARSLSARDQTLAAMVCAEQARELGVDHDDLAALHEELRGRLGDAWPRFQAWIGDAE